MNGTPSAAPAVAAAVAGPFRREAARLTVDGVDLDRIAEQVGTPTYVYSRAYLEQRYRLLEEAMQPLGADIRYAVKANGNLSVLRCFHELGAGFDIVSGGELQRVLAAGGDPARVVFSGVGKSEAEIDFALKLDIGCFNVESAAELERIAARARLLARVAPVSIRVNPDVDAQTHPYISTGLKNNKFGVPAAEALALYRRASTDPALAIRGLDCHIGSQIGTLAPLLEALTGMLELVDQLAHDGIRLEHLDLGGGFGVRYRDEPDFDIGAYGAAVNQALSGRGLKLMLEPGRFLVANGGLLLTRVEYLKPAQDPDGRNFAVIDAAMNDLIRPALYQAWHDVVPAADAPAGTVAKPWQLVGPVCESGDFIAHDRELALVPGQLLAILSAGAYGMVQSSNYNSRNRPAEVLVEDGGFRVVRQRETIRDQLRLERFE